MPKGLRRRRRRRRRRIVNEQSVKVKSNNAVASSAYASPSAHTLSTSLSPSLSL